MVINNISGVTNPEIGRILDYFPTKTLKATELYFLILEGIQKVELFCDLQVIGVIG